MKRKIKILMLDAMGVIYKHGDDVAELLIPFVQSKDSNISDKIIIDNYRQASLGRISSKDFWENMGLSQNLEDEYLESFELAEEVIDFLKTAQNHFKEIICLSNDVSEWSEKLRVKFGLTEYIKKWFISGDLKRRKPSPQIYRKILENIKVTDPKEILFIDDNIDNISAAEELGFEVLLLSDSYNGPKDHIDKLDLLEIEN
ncbi:MAG: HAD-IA family hydrolase [Actinomycetia bacterium]|nr:HAD-IA family hydrolase [Actinomycetes bacterium]